MVPKIGRVFHYTPSILGVPLCLETPTWINILIFTPHNVPFLAPQKQAGVSLGMTYDCITSISISLLTLMCQISIHSFPHTNEAQLILAGLQFQETAPKYLEFVQYMMLISAAILHALYPHYPKINISNYK